MSITLSTTARNAAANAVVDTVDQGSGAGKLNIYTTGLGTLLASLTFADPAFGAASVGVATAGTIADDASADATGTAAEFTVTDSDDNVLFEGSVGGPASGEDMELNTTSVIIGGSVACSSFTFTQPAS